MAVHRNNINVAFFLLQGRLCSRSKKPLITDQTLLWKLVLQSIKDPSLWIVRGHIAEHEWHPSIHSLLAIPAVGRSRSPVCRRAHFFHIVILQQQSHVLADQSLLSSNSVFLFFNLLHCEQEFCSHKNNATVLTIQPKNSLNKWISVILF